MSCSVGDFVLAVYLLTIATDTSRNMSLCVSEAGQDYFLGGFAMADMMMTWSHCVSGWYFPAGWYFLAGRMPWVALPQT